MENNIFMGFMALMVLLGALVMPGSSKVTKKIHKNPPMREMIMPPPTMAPRGREVTLRKRKLR